MAKKTSKKGIGHRIKKLLKGNKSAKRTVRKKPVKKKVVRKKPVKRPVKKKVVKKTAKRPAKKAVRKKVSKKPVKKKAIKKKAAKKKSVKKKIVKEKPVKKVPKKPVIETPKEEVTETMTEETKKRHDIQVVNIVVSTSLEHDIPLEKMAATLSNTEYNPEQFPGLVIRIKDPKTSALIFSSGNVVCTGARSMEKVEESIQKIIESLEKIGITINIKPVIHIQNIVASGNIGLDLNLNTLAMKLDNTEYEPEQFPGLVYKLMEAKATFLLFSNGKVVCTGTKSEEEVYKALDMLVEVLKKVT
jgi:transcription initiation factor TFIID TATA-box-binding protein